MNQLNQQTNQQPNFPLNQQFSNLPINHQSTTNQQSIYDLIIIGSGPAGLTSSIYASRYHLKNVVIGQVLGGTMTQAHRVENYPGFVSISGIELAQKMAEQVKALGAQILSENVTKIQKSPASPGSRSSLDSVEGGSPGRANLKNQKPALQDSSGMGNLNFKIVTENSQEFESKALIVATGTERRKLNIPGEAEYLGKGVSYCTTCDLPFFKDKVVAVVGGADAACTGAVHAADVCRKTYLIYRKDELRAEPTWVQEVEQNPKIEVIYNSNLTQILGDGQKVTGIKLDKVYQGSEELKLDGIFVEIGGVPVTGMLKQIGVNLDEGGFVKVNPDMSTNIPGLFAAGDLANVFGEMHQITIATSEGSVAASSAFKYLKGQSAPVSYGGNKK